MDPFIKLFERFSEISIGATIVDGPYGGGNTFLLNYINYLKIKTMK